MRLLPFILFFVLAVPARAQPTRLDSIDRFVRAEMAAGHLPGLALAVVRGDSVVYVRGYGFADFEHRDPATDSTAFLIASVTKTVTATAVLRLVEEGRWSSPSASSRQSTTSPTSPTTGSA